MSEALAIVDSLLNDDPKDFALSTRRYDKSTDKFHNSDGSLSNYAFACGYVQQVEIMGVNLSLWKEGLWQVRAHDHHAGRRLFWDSFEKRGDAVRRYNQELRRLQAQQKTTGLRENEDDGIDPKDYALEIDPDKVYFSIVFFQGDDEFAREAWSILDNDGEQACLEHLASYDYGDANSGAEYEITDEPWGAGDDVYRGKADDAIYVLSYNRPLRYIGLCREEFKYGLPDDQQNS